MMVKILSQLLAEYKTLFYLQKKKKVTDVQAFLFYRGKLWYKNLIFACNNQWIP